EDYRNRLYRQLSPARRVLWNITEAAKSSPCRIVYPEGDHENIIRAARRVADANIAQPILLGVPERILSRARAAGISLDGVSLVDPRRDLRLERYAHHYWERRCRKGVTQEESVREMQRFRTSFGMMMVEVGDADGIVAGARQDYPATIRPALRIIGTRPDVRKACGMYMVITKTRVTFLADTTINIDPDAQTLAEIARLAAERVRELGIEPRVAMLS